ncbi:hypothetical protein ACHQM5_000886 [Ranunculus cassubicifolius]
MGVGGKFWDLLKPYSRNEDFNFLRNKKIAIDLSFWIVQQETAIRNKARNPHIRLTFFRTINLFSKLGAFPIFVVDGIPSPLKARARMERFCRFSGIGLEDIVKKDDGGCVERNGAFQKCVRECVELLELLGMPVLKARCEAEALCAQLNHDGHVDACITADSDAFLYGAKCVVKSIQPNSKEPFECYHMSDIETDLGLKRIHLVAISLLVGNDHDLTGVAGIGIETALRFVRMFPEDEILKRLHEVGKGDIPFLIDNMSAGDCDLPSSSENSPKVKHPHCSHCGHPGSKRAHSKLACEQCIVSGNEGCLEKPSGFKCECSSCILGRKNKEQKKRESWQLSVCKKISSENNFPNDEIIEMYLSHNHSVVTENEILSLAWEKPKLETLIDFLVYHQHWDPSYIRQRILPMLSTNFLRDMASNPTEGFLLHGQYEFNYIQRVKIRYGQPCYLVTWRKPVPVLSSSRSSFRNEWSDEQNDDILGETEVIDLLDECDAPQIVVEGDSSLLVTEENMELVQAAFPEKVEIFLHEKEMKESKSRKKKPANASDSDLETPKLKGVQLSIKEFYRVQAKPAEAITSIPPNKAKEKRRIPTSNLSKSVRRRLLFD